MNKTLETKIPEIIRQSWDEFKKLRIAPQELEDLFSSIHIQLKRVHYKSDTEVNEDQSNHAQLIMMEKGQCIYNSGMNKYILTAKNALIIPPHTNLHKSVFTGEGWVSMYIFTKTT